MTSGLLLALASAFLLWRLYRVLVRYRARAKDESRELVPTAGTIIDEVVGRDQLCKVVMEDLHDRRTRRPHVLIGGVGTGKTAVLVRLTEFLAEKHAVPVPIRLRDAVTDLDFEAMAQGRFTSEVDRYLLSSAEGEKIWRRLRKDGRIVVLADGLEEALNGNQERNNIIRAAIRKAHGQHLPLVIASRPHDPLKASEAAILELEPLSYEAALTYLCGDGTSQQERRLGWIVETADVVEAPLYLQITRELYQKGLLEHTSAAHDGVLDTRGVDRSKLRLELLRTWERALVRGHIRDEIPLNRAERRATIEQLSALACVGLKTDQLDVGFDDPLGVTLAAEVQRRLGDIEQEEDQARGLQNIDVRLAAAWGAQLRLVETRGNGVRFPHSLLEAYLGSRLINAALLDPDYRKDAFEATRPGREFLIALVLRSRAGDDKPTELRRGESARPPGTNLAAAGRTDPAGAGPSEQARSRRAPQQARPGRAEQAQRLPATTVQTAGLGNLTGSLGAQAQPWGEQEEICQLLRRKARNRDDNKALDIYAAALEIDCVATAPAHPAIADEIVRRWPQIHAQDPSTLEEGKLGLVRRFGEAVRAIDKRRYNGECLTEPAYRQFYTIGCGEPSYPVRHAVAQEIGTGADTAYAALRHEFMAPCSKCKAERDGKKGGQSGNKAARDGKSVAKDTNDRREAKARASDSAASGADSSHAWIMSAWLAPLLVGSVGAGTGRTASVSPVSARSGAGAATGAPAGDDRAHKDLVEGTRDDLARWLRHVGTDGRKPGEEDLPLSLEIALAQGFKYAANRRYPNTHAGRDTRIYLAEQALEMTKGARYWFSQLTLIQALCLLHLLEEPRSASGRGSSKPEAMVEHWLRVAGRRHAGDGQASTNGEPHPFVREAAELAILALKTRQPERYCWIDESGVIARVGSHMDSVRAGLRKHQVWIPPSTGWSALDRRAQRLVADVFLLLNLAERGDQPRDRERRLARANRHDLPPCITHDRQPLEPGRTVGMAASSAPGTNCIAGCAFELCPYPPKGMQPKAEMSEAFCRRQQTLLYGYTLGRRRAGWQKMRTARLAQFWLEMAERARGPRAESAVNGGVPGRG